jgi:hypothetical protein
LLRSYLVLPVGQGTRLACFSNLTLIVSHKISVIMKRMTLNSSRTDVKPLAEKDAVDLGADIIGEVFVYSVAAVILIREYVDNAAKTFAKEEKLNKRLHDLEAHVLRVNDELAQVHMESMEMRVLIETLTKRSPLSPHVPESPDAKTLLPSLPSP